MTRRPPWPAPEDGSAPGPLAMTEEELSSFINGVKFFDPVSEPKPEPKPKPTRAQG